MKSKSRDDLGSVKASSLRIIPKKKKAIRFYKNHQLKLLILRAIRAGHNDVDKIIKAIDYPLDDKKGLTIDSMYVELNYLRRAVPSFIHVDDSGDKRVYSLTKRGLEHAINPYVDVEKQRAKRKDIIKEQVMNILSNDTNFRQAVIDFANEHGIGSASSYNPVNPVIQRIVESGSVNPNEIDALSKMSKADLVNAIASSKYASHPEFGDAYLRQELDMVRKMNEELRERNSGLENALKGSENYSKIKYADSVLERNEQRLAKERSLEKISAKDDEDRRNMRQALVAQYYKNGKSIKYLDSAFVTRWMNITPKLLTENASGERQLLWTSSSSSIVEKGFVQVDLHQKQAVEKVKFYIASRTSKGIVIKSGFKEFMSYQQTLEW